MQTDVRVITATNRNLEREVAAGRFRMDLYYRLNVFPITLPPLRDRKGDIPLLADHFNAFYCAKMGKSKLSISESALNELLQHDWPGNIRELEHAVERAVLLSGNNGIKTIFIPDRSEKISILDKKIKTIEENERDHIISVLKKCNGKLSGKGGAAELLGINASTLNSRIKKLNISKTKNEYR